MKPAESVALAVEPVARPARRRFGARLGAGSAPYLLVTPALLVILGVLGYPLYLLVKISFQKYGLFELIQHKGKWVGVDNYSRILGDWEFWLVALRTTLFAAVNVGLTIVFGTLFALLLTKLGAALRLALTTVLVLVWATPVVVAVNIWSWMVDYEFGVANWTLTKLHVGNFIHHDWFVNPVSGFGIITALIVWGAIPFVTITIYAGLTQVPPELLEAAEIDGAGRWRSFRDITFPILKPVFIIITSLSVIWDFQVFNQVWIMRNSRPTDDYFLLSIYSFVNSFKLSAYGLGAAIALVMVLIMLVVTFFYIRQMVRIGEVQ